MRAIEIGDIVINIEIISMLHMQENGSAKAYTVIPVDREGRYVLSLTAEQAAAVKAAMLADEAAPTPRGSSRPGS